VKIAIETKSQTSKPYTYPPVEVLPETVSAFLQVCLALAGAFGEKFAARIELLRVAFWTERHMMYTPEIVLIWLPPAGARRKIKVSFRSDAWHHMTLEDRVKVVWDAVRQDQQKLAGDMRFQLEQVEEGTLAA
jgi:hypothetical protein